MGCSLTTLRVDGGASADDLLMQFQADISGIRVLRPDMKEATAAGAAYLAGLAVGFWQDRAEIAEHLKSRTIFSPEMTAERRCELLDGWRRAVRACKEM